jgi:cytoskeleton protein RodZ
MTEAVSMVEATDAPARPGLLLAAAREGCALSVADVARQLKLSPWQVEALEADDYRRLPGVVFVRGFIRNYARLVKLDAAPLLAGAEQRLPPATQAAPQMPPSADIPFPTGREFRWRKYAIAALLLLAPVVIFELYRDEAAEITVKLREVALPPPQIAGQDKAVAASIEPQVAATGDAAAGSASAVSAATQPMEVTAERSMISAPTAAVERKPGEHSVRFRFERESWVEIHDKNGHKIFSQLNSAGTRRTVNGLPPLSLVVGNAAGVRLVHNEQPVNLGPYTQADVARLILE